MLTRSFICLVLLCMACAAHSGNLSTLLAVAMHSQLKLGFAAGMSLPHTCQSEMRDVGVPITDVFCIPNRVSSIHQHFDFTRRGAG